MFVCVVVGICGMWKHCGAAGEYWSDAAAALRRSSLIF